MSKKTVDERVVEMRFDNSQFESNVKTSMSTLEKLKQSLKFSNTSKGLDNLSSAAKKVDFSGMASGIETVNARFSNMQVIGMTALSNITTAAMQAGTNLVKSFTIDPITSGFREYELQMNSIQTILANTKSKGTTMDDVTKALDELNEYADLTIYNFAEMTKNIGTFTAAGVDLDTSVGAIKGIANLGAMSSSTSAQVSTAMYQLSQALATGRVSLMDWNSVVNAGMGGEQFQNALKRTAENFGYDVDGMIKKYGSFRESLTQGGWLTAEVLNETLNQIGGAYDETALKAKGYSDEQIKAILDLAETATNAATEVKTFTQLMDTLKEAAGSGWAKTWQLIFGDFEEAKSFFSDLHEMLEPVVTGPIDAMNEVIAEAMGGGESRWSEFTAELDKAGVSVESFQSKLTEVASGKGVDLNKLIEEYGSLEKAIASGDISAGMITDTLKALASSTGDATANTAELNKMLSKYQTVVDQVWRGDFANVDTGRIEKLTAAGWKFEEVQKLVNMTVDGHRLTLEDLSAAQIVSLGYTQEQADALVSLAKEAESAGQPLDELINSLVEPKRSGRELFLEGIKNLLTAIMKPLQAVGKAFGEVFSVDASNLYDLIEGFNSLTKSLIISDDDAENLTKTFKGLLSIVKLVATAAGKTFALAFNVAQKVLGFFGTNVLEVTGNIGEAIYQFTEWVLSGQAISDVFGGLIELLGSGVAPIQNFFAGFAQIEVVKTATSYISGLFEGLFDYIKELSKMSPGDAVKKIVQDIQKALSNLSWDNFIEGLSSFGEKVRETFEKLKEKFEEIGPDLIEGLKNGLTDNIEKVVEFMKDIGEKIIEAIKAVLGIHSPSTVMFEIGQNIVQGLINGIQSLIGGVAGCFAGLGDGIKEVIESIDWGAVTVVLAGAAAFGILYKFTDALQMFGTAAKNVTAPAAGIGSVLTSVSKAIDAFAGNISGGTKFQNFANAAKTLATAIAILVGAIAALTVLDQGKMWNAVGVIGALAVIVGVLAVAVNKFATGNAIDALKLGGLFTSLAASLLLLSVSAKIIGGMEWSDLGKVAAALAGFGLVIAGLTALVTFGKQSVDGAAAFVAKVGAAFLLLAVTAKILGTMSGEELDRAGDAIAGFGIVVMGLIAVTSLAGKNIDKASSMIMKVGVAFLLLAATAKILGGMDSGEIQQAREAITGFGILIVGLMAATKLLGKAKGIAAIGGTLLSVAAAIGILAVVARLIAGMSWGDMGKAAAGLVGLGAIIAGLIAATNLAPKGEMAKVAGTLLAMSLSIAILAGVAVLLGMVETEKLVKGIIAIGLIGAIMAGLVAVSKFGKSIDKGTFIGMAIAIGVLAASLVVLSLIDPAKLASAVIGLSVTMAALSLMMKMSGRMKKATTSILAMAALVAILGGVLYILGGLPIGASLANALALSVLLAAMSGACAILQKIKKVSPGALGAMAAITLIVAAIGGVLALLAYFNADASVSNVIAISTMLLAMSGVCSILSQIKAVSPAALGAMAILTLIVAGLGVVLGLLSYFDVTPSLETAASLSIMLLAMSAAVAILGAIGPLAQGAVPAAIAMAEVLGILALVVAAAGAIKQIPGAEWLISEGGSFLQSLGNAIGGFVGSLVGGFGEGVSDSLPAIADNLSSFMENLTPFIDGVKMIDPSVQESITSLVAAIAMLTGASFLEAITSFLTGGSSLEDFAEELVPFGEAMVEYSNTVSGIDAAAVTASATAAAALGQLAENLPKEGGLAQAIFGESPDLETFGTQMVAFGNAMRDYSVAISGIDTAAITDSATAGQALSDLASSLPKEGGLAQAIFGENTDLGTFGTQLFQFGMGLRLYSASVSGLDVASIQASVGAGQALANLSQSLGTNGGALEWLIGGDKDFSDFANNLTDFGDALSAYSTKITGIDFNQMSIATSRVQTLSNFIKSTSDMDTSGIENIKKITEVGGALLSYSTMIMTVDVAKIQSSITSIQSLKTLIESMAGMDASGISTFKSAVSSLAETNISGVVNAFNSAGDKLSTVGSNLATMLAGGLKNGGGHVKTAALVVIGDAVSAINAKGAEFLSAGKLLITQLLAGINTSKGLVNLAITGLLKDAASSIRNYYSQFSSAGRYLANGLAAGIRSGRSSVSTAAASIANAAASTAKSILQIRSPSRVFREIGSYIPAGMAQGIDMYSGYVADSVESMAKTATEGTQKALSRLSSIDFDANPTITPVLDLSNVEEGAGLIGNMLTLNTPIGALGSVGAISRMMNSRNQNGGFDDVVSAVNRLRSTIGDMSRPSYNIGGITYDDGSVVANAVGDLVRAARIERRI